MNLHTFNAARHGKEHADSSGFGVDAADPRRLLHDRARCGKRKGAGMWHVSFLVGVALASTACGSAWAQPASELFRGADLALGAKLMDEHRCVACHVRQVGGDGASIYRPKGRINTPGFLRGMVEQCNTEMNLGLFPEEVSAIAAVLNRDHYKFK